MIPRYLSIKRKLILTIVCFIFFSIFSMGLITYLYETSMFEKSFRDFAQSQNQSFINSLSNEATDMAGIHSGLTRLDSLLKPFAARNSRQLLAAAEPVFAELRQNCNITHMYFITTDGTVFLRVHKPEQSGDKLQRETFRQAAQNHRIASGLELGLNFFSLRSVSPVYVGGVLIGYLEIAKEIDHIFYNMKKNSGYEFAVFLNESYLQNQTTYLTGQRIGTYEILYPTDKSTSEKLASRLYALDRQPLEFRVILESFGNKKVYMGASPLHDAAGKIAGTLVAHKDVSSMYLEMWQRIVLMSLAFIAIILLASLILIISIRKSTRLFFALHDRITEISKTSEMSEEVQVTVSDEIGSLAKAFNSMMKELKSQKKELLEQMEFKRTLIEISPIPIYYKDLHGKYLGCNQSFSRFLGLEKSQIIGRVVADLAPPKNAETYHQKDQELFEGGNQIQIYESNVVSVDGVQHDVIFYKAPFYDSEMQLAGLVGSILDITEQRQYINTLLESENRFRTLFDNIIDAVFVHDHYGNIVEVNAIAITRLGYSRDEFINMNIKDIVVQEDITQLPTYFQKAAEEGISLQGAQRHRNGNIIPIEISSKGFEFNGKKMLIGVTRDITEKIRMEKEHEQLEQQLLQAQKMELVGHMAGGIAHDFNNLLQVIVGYSSMLQTDSKLNDKQRCSVDQVISAAEKATELTRGLLAFSRKQVIAPKVANLNTIVQQVKKLLDRIIGEDIQCSLMLTDLILRVYVDSGQIEQVLLNLATNARDAMHKGGHLTIKTGLQQVTAPLENAVGKSEAGRYAWIEMADTGCGMDKETSARIFEPFFTTKEIGKGTGLGMSIIYGIICQHNGFIVVNSEPDTGTSFRIYLPVFEKPSSFEEESTTLPKNQGGSETILLAEDNSEVRDYLTSLLELFGYEVLIAADGQEAVEIFASNRDRIKLVLLDMIMPKKNGKEAYIEISRFQTDVKVLYLSGYTADFIEDRGVSREGVELITKPIKPQDLLCKIREVLDSPSTSLSAES